MIFHTNVRSITFRILLIKLFNRATDPLANSSVKFDYDCGLDVIEHDGIGMHGLYM